MADQNPGVYNIADLREMALRRVSKDGFEFVDRVMASIGCRGVAALGPEYLQFVDPAFRPAGPGRPSLKLLDSNRAVGEG